MNTPAEIWIHELVSFAAQKHLVEPAPLRSDFSDVEEQQCRILGGHLITWLNEWGPGMIMERNMLAHMKNWDKDPHIVYITAGPGLAAAQEILEGSEQAVTWLTETQFQEFLTLHPDENQTHHCILESWFRPPAPEEESRLRRQNNLGLEGILWIHHDHTLMGPLFTRGGLSLWLDHDGQMTLTEEGYETWLS